MSSPKTVNTDIPSVRNAARKQTQTQHNTTLFLQFQFRLLTQHLNAHFHGGRRGGTATAGSHEFQLHHWSIDVGDLAIATIALQVWSQLIQDLETNLLRDNGRILVLNGSEQVLKRMEKDSNLRASWTLSQVKESLGFSAFVSLVSGSFFSSALASSTFVSCCHSERKVRCGTSKSKTPFSWN